MKTIHRIITVVLIGCMLLTIASVLPAEYGFPLTIQSASAEKNPSLSVTKKTLTVGQSVAIKVKNAGKQKVSWSSSNKAVATVSSKGVVKAVANGTAIISAKVGKKVLKATITVKKKPAFNKSALSKYFYQTSEKSFDFDFQFSGSDAESCITISLTPATDEKGKYRTAFYGWYYSYSEYDFSETTDYYITVDGRKFSFSDCQVTISFSTNKGRPSCGYVEHPYLDKMLKLMRKAKKIEIGLGFKYRYGDIEVPIFYSVKYSGNDRGLKTLKAMAEAVYKSNYFNYVVKDYGVMSTVVTAKQSRK